jgi:hypothetical protein
MASTRPSWFLAPRAPLFDCSPDGYLQLGSLISDPFAPDRPITRAPPPPLPDNIIIDGRHQTNWKEVVDRRKSLKFSLWARFLDLIRVDDIGAEWNSATLNAYRFDTLECKWFIPPMSLLRERMELAEIQEFSSSGWLRPKLYMVTGIMIARNPAVERTTDESWRVRASANADIAGTGLAVGAGELGMSGSTHKSTSATASTDFVFAYRLSEIKYKRKSGAEQASAHGDTPHTTGSSFTNDGPRKGPAKPTTADLDTLEVSEVTADGLSVESLSSVDKFSDGDDYQSDCIVP